MVRALPTKVRALAADRAGVLSRAELVRAGFTDEAIEAQVRGERWSRRFPGVYQTRGAGNAQAAETWAALVYAGSGATVSHESAAQLWGLTDDRRPSGGRELTGGREPTVHLTIPGHRRVRPQAGLTLHVSRRLAHTRHPTRTPLCTRVEDTVLDLIEGANSLEVAISWVMQACQRRRTTTARLREAAGRRGRLRWRVALDGVLADVADGAETPLELAYVRRVERGHALPAARRQRHRRAGAATQWIDGDYEEYRTRVELDGRLGHVEEGAFPDHRRDNLSTEEGYVTLRYGWVAAYEDSCATACQVARILRWRGWAGRPRPRGPGCPVGFL